MFILKITTDNDAFSGPLRLLHDTGYPGKDISLRYELARILQSAVRMLEFYPDCNHSLLHDVNGNSVGHFEITDEPGVQWKKDTNVKGETQ
jgi:hypothetical protein